MTANPQNNCQNCDGVGSVVEYIEGEQGVCVTTCPSCDGTGESTPAPSGLAGEAVAKPLEWRYIPDAFPPMWITKTTIGSYHIEEAAGSDSPSFDLYNPMAGPMGNYEGLDEAKAAAQADFETRIRSALAVPPSIPAGGVAVSDAWQPIETAPKDGSFVFLYWPTLSITRYPAVGFHHGDEYGWELASDRDYGEVLPTHWRPLFAPPAALSPEAKTGERS